MFVTRRKVCILWKLEGDISVSGREYRPSSSGGIPRVRARAARAQEDLLHSQRRRARARHAFEKKQLCDMCLLHLGCLKFAMHTAARRKAAFVDLEK